MGDSMVAKAEVTVDGDSMVERVGNGAEVDLRRLGRVDFDRDTPHLDVSPVFRADGLPDDEQDQPITMEGSQKWQAT